MQINGSGAVDEVGGGRVGEGDRRAGGAGGLGGDVGRRTERGRGRVLHGDRERARGQLPAVSWCGAAHGRRADGEGRSGRRGAGDRGAGGSGVARRRREGDGRPAGPVASTVWLAGRFNVGGVVSHATTVAVAEIETSEIGPRRCCWPPCRDREGQGSGSGSRRRAGREGDRAGDRRADRADGRGVPARRDREVEPADERRDGRAQAAPPCRWRRPSRTATRPSCS